MPQIKCSSCLVKDSSSKAERKYLNMKNQNFLKGSLGPSHSHAKLKLATVGDSRLCYYH